MPDIALKGHHSAGHDACPAVPAVEGASTVHVAGRPVLRAGDAFAVHGCRAHPSHQGRIGQGAPFIHIEGRAVARKNDPVSCGKTLDYVAEGFPSVRVGNCGGAGYGGEIALDAYRQTLPMRQGIQEGDLLVPCIPDICETEAMRQAMANDARGWLYFADFMRRWLYGPAHEGGEGIQPSWIGWDWLMTYLTPAQAWKKFIEFNYLFTYNSRNLLAKRLKRDGYFERPGEFDYINTDWPNWKHDYFQSIGMNPRSPSYLWWIDGFDIAIGRANYYALAKGRTEKNDGKIRVTVTAVAGVFFDTFGFEGAQRLGNWNCEERRWGGIFPSNLHNSDFETYRQRTGKGEDFYILAEPHSVDIGGEYTYDMEP